MGEHDTIQGTWDQPQEKASQNDDGPMGGGRSSMIGEIQNTWSFDEQQAVASPKNKKQGADFGFEQNSNYLDKKTRLSLENSQDELGGEDSFTKTLALTDKETSEFRSAAKVGWKTRSKSVVTSLTERHDSAEKKIKTARSAASKGRGQLYGADEGGAQADETHANLVKGVESKADAAELKLAAFRRELMSQIQIPHSVAAPAEEELNGAAVRKHLKGVNTDLDVALGVVEKAMQQFKKDPRAGSMEPIAAKLPSHLTSFAVHALVDWQMSKLDINPPYGAVIEFITASQEPVAEFLPALKTLGIGDESDESVATSRGLLAKFVRRVMHKDTNLNTHNILEGIAPAPKFGVNHFTHPGITVVADDIRGILSDASTFGTALQKQQSLDPQADEEQYQTLGKSAVTAYSRSRNRVVPKNVLSSLLEGTDEAKHVDGLLTLLDELKFGMFAKMASRTKDPDQPEQAQEEPDSAALESALKSHDNALASAAEGLQLKFVGNAAKLFKKEVTDAKKKDKNPTDLKGQIGEIKDRASYGTLALNAAKESLDDFSKIAEGAANAALKNPDSVTRGVRLARASNKATDAAKGLSAVTSKVGFGLGVVSILLNTHTLMDEDASHIEKLNAGYGVASGVVSVGGTVAGWAGASTLSAAAAPVGVLLAYFQLLSNQFAKMAAMKEEGIHRNRIQTVGKLANYMARASEYTDMVQTAQDDKSAPGASGISEAYTNKASNFFSHIYGALGGNKADQVGLNLLADMYDGMIGWDDEIGALRDYCDTADFKTLRGANGPVTPEQMVALAPQALQRLRKLMDHLMAEIVATQEKYAPKDKKKKA